MSPLIVILFILLAIAGTIALAVRKVLTTPMRPPAPPTDLQVKPLVEVRPPDESRGAAAQGPSEVADTAMTAVVAGLVVAHIGFSFMSVLRGRRPFHAAAGLLHLTSHLAGVATRRQYNAPIMSGGDKDLGRRPIPVNHKEHDTPRLHVLVRASGAIEVEGRVTTLADLEQRLADLKDNGGKVTYECEHTESEPPQAAQVLDAIFKSGLPVTFAGKAAPT